MRLMPVPISVWLASFLLLLSFHHPASAVTITHDDPELMLKQATDEMLAISKAARAYVENDRQRYYDQVSAILDQVIDKDYFARGVMATYASARLYKSLQTQQERDVFKARVTRFADELQDVLIEKYADALLVFDGDRIEVERLGRGDNSSGKVSLQQTIYDTGDKTYLVQYHLHQRKGGWLINNVIVEGINLGATYRTQFAEAVERNRNDVDYVVNHWRELMSQQRSKDNDDTGPVKSAEGASGGK